MNKEFGFPADWLYYSTREVMENPREFCLNNFQLEEEVNHNPDSQISISEWLAAFPQKENDYLGIAFVNRGDSERLRQFCGEIVNLAIPPRVRNLEITPDFLLADAITKQLAQDHRPSIIVAKGKESERNEALTVLFCPQGMTPEKALAIVKRIANDKYWELTAKNN